MVKLEKFVLHIDEAMVSIAPYMQWRRTPAQRALVKCFNACRDNLSVESIARGEIETLMIVPELIDLVMSEMGFVTSREFCCAVTDEFRARHETLETVLHRIAYLVQEHHGPFRPWAMRHEMIKDILWSLTGQDAEDFEVMGEEFYDLALQQR